MKKNNTILAILLAACFAIFSAPANATVTHIDLNDFFADPTVIITGTLGIDQKATFTESNLFASSTLTNDPGFGDPNVIIPSAGAMLMFDYSFTEGNGNDDEFFASLLGPAGFPVFDPSSEFSLLADSTMSGSVSFDMSSFVGDTIGLQFSLDAFDMLLDSTAEISNLKIVTPDADAQDVPLPPVTGLMFIGFIWLNFTRRNRKVNKLIN